MMLLYSLILTSLSAYGATYTVGSDGDFSSIQDAITASVSGDRIEVGSGVYAETLDPGGKDLTIIGTSGPLTTILSPPTAGLAVVTYDEGETGSLSGFSIEPPSGERGIYISGASPSIENCRIEGAGDWESMWGGAVYVEAGTPTFTSIEFRDNEGARGGDMHITGAAFVTMDDIQFEGSSAKYGGGLYIESSNVTINNAEADEINSQYSGGFAHLIDATLTATNLDIRDPNGDTTHGVGLYARDRSIVSWFGGGVFGATMSGMLSGYSGGAIYLAESSTLSGNDLEFRENEAYNGGALEIIDGSSATLAGVQFDGNSAHRAGGAMRVAESAEVQCTLCVFDSNSADRGGAVDVAVDASFEDTDGSYVDNEATDQDGGAIRVSGEASLVVSGASFQGNEANAAGGAVHLLEPGEATLISDSSFQSNVAEAGAGGAILADLGASLTVSGSTFDDNTSSLGSGGAIAFEPVTSGQTLTVTGSAFESNDAEDEGGAIFAKDAESITIEDSVFIRNRAPSGDAGAVHLEESEEYLFRRVVFHANTASGRGGAIFDVETSGAGVMENCVFTENSGGAGGAVHLTDNGSQAELVNLTFAGNDASIAGAHLYLDAATVSFVNNIAWSGQDGGGLFAADGPSGSGSDFFYNDVGNNSGGNYEGALSDPTGASGNISSDPMFRDYSIDGDEDNDNLYLILGSPCMDAGDPSIVDVDGSRSDIGAFGGPNADADDGDMDGHYDITDCNDDDAGIYPGAVEFAYDGVDQDCDGADLIDVDGDGFDADDVGGTDCDDADEEVYPGAAETWYDGIDGNCDGESDFDADGDGFDWDVYDGLDCDDTDAAIRPEASDSVGDGIDQNCDGVDGTDADGDGFPSIATGGDDCNDGDATIYPGAIEIAYDDIDQDCDGTDLRDADGDGYEAESAGGMDCDDTDASVYPSAPETWYDGIDSDCNGRSDYDADLDGYDSSSWDGGDCNDDDPLVHPDATEIWYDDIDQDCAGDSDFDRDGDGSLSADHGTAAEGYDDCDDDDDSMYPGATDIPYDGIDQDCDGADVDDVDGDGFAGGEFGPDCDDEDPTIYPSAPDTYYDGIDSNCDGMSDYDKDADGHDSSVYGGDDCDDENGAVNPDVAEVWYDDIDDNCDGNRYDQDGDGYESAGDVAGGEDCDDEDENSYPGAEEVKDGKDNDCDGFDEMADRDGDGLVDWDEWRLETDPEDGDSDGDGWLDGEEVPDVEAPPDTDGDGRIDALDPDDDGDKIPTLREQTEDANGDGSPNPDADGDGVPNALDLDSDGDGVPDVDEGTLDADGDGIADYVDFQGGLLGGGCAGCNGSGSERAPIWMIVLLGALLVRRRESTELQWNKGAGVLLAACFFVANTAEAQELQLPQLDARGFWVSDTAGDPRRSVRLLYPAVGDTWDAGMVVDYASQPLRERQPAGPVVLIDSLVTTHVFGAWDQGPFRFDISYPFTVYGQDQIGGFVSSGDARVGAMWAAKPPENGRPGIGVQLVSWLPTGTRARWSGSPGVSVGPVLALAQEIGSFGYTVNAGLRLGNNKKARNVMTGSGPVGGFDIHYVLPVLDEMLAVGGEMVIQGATGFDSFPVEPGVRLRGRLPGGGFAVLGGSSGLGEGIGATQFRVYAGVGYGGIPPEPTPEQGAVVVPVILERIERAAKEGPLAELVDNRIVIREQVFFKEAKAEILAASEPVLQAVIQVLNEHPSIEHLLIEGHTNSRASRQYNRRLSQARAEAVAAWLELNGVDGSRLIPKGFGEDRPLVKDNHPDAMVINRRVEFTVLRSDESGEQGLAPDVKQLPKEVQEDR